MKKFAQMGVVVALTVFAVACGGTEENKNNNVNKNEESSKIVKEEKDNENKNQNDNDDKGDKNKSIELDEEDEGFDISDIFGDDDTTVLTTLTMDTEEEVVVVTKKPTMDTEEEVTVITNKPAAVVMASDAEQTAVKALLAGWKKIHTPDEANLKSEADAVRNSLGKGLSFNTDAGSVATIDSLQNIIDAVDGNGPKKCRVLGGQYAKVAKSLKHEFDTHGKDVALSKVESKVANFLKNEPLCVNDDGALIDMQSDLTKTLTSFVKNDCK